MFYLEVCEIFQDTQEKSKLIRGVARTPTNIQDGKLCNNSERILVAAGGGPSYASVNAV